MSDQGPALPPPGWYADPSAPSQQRYWDGATWTEHTAPGTPGTGGVPAASQGGAAAPDPWLWQSIVATLLCCLPLGIAGIVYAARSQSAAGRGDMAEAQSAARSARTWTLWAIGAGVVVGVVVVAFGLLGTLAPAFVELG